MKRPRARFYDLKSVIPGAADKTPKEGRRVPQIRVPTKTRRQGQCPACGGSKVIQSSVPGVTLLCPYCTGYQKCGL